MFTTNISGWYLTNAVHCAPFPGGTELAPGEYFVLASNTNSFSNKYGWAPDYEYTNHLSNAGDTVTVCNASGAPVPVQGVTDGSLRHDLAGYRFRFEDRIRVAGEEHPS